jgi:hypothetical protein
MRLFNVKKWFCIVWFYRERGRERERLY